MEKKSVFRGVGTALVTPFSGGKIDYDALSGLIERQISAGISALVIGGTTGEAATLDREERYELFKRSRDMVAGRCPVIFGTGTNDTRGAVRHTEEAERIGCDGVLVVTPYYNRGTRDGVVRHYKEIAAATSLPVILYNVPTRTGVNLSLDVLEELAEVENIVGIKEAQDSQDRLTDIAAMDSLRLYAGNDSATYSVLSLGGDGVISVVSNLYPRETVEICKAYFEGRREEAFRLQMRLLPVIKALFLETNPAPLKYAMWQAGLCSADMRLPMWLPTAATRAKIDTAVRRFEEGLLPEQG